MKLLPPCVIESFKTKLKNTTCQLYTNHLTLIDEAILEKQSQKSLIFIKPNSNFNQLYFISSDLDDLSLQLQNLVSKNLYIEIIQKGELDPIVKSTIQKHFDFKTTYEKLLINTKNLKLKMLLNTIPQSIVNADKKDLNFIYKNLYQNFDARFDHLPDKAGLKNLIENNQIITVKNNNQISAYCIYTLNGKSSHFNYLINLEASSFELLALIESYYKQIKEKNIQYIHLWVDIFKNLRVKNMHLKYGYQSSGIFNYTFEKIN